MCVRWPNGFGIAFLSGTHRSSIIICTSVTNKQTKSTKEESTLEVVIVFTVSVGKYGSILFLEMVAKLMIARITKFNFGTGKSLINFPR